MTTKTRDCEHHTGITCNFDSCDSMCWTYIEHYVQHSAAPTIQPPEGWSFDDFFGLVSARTGQGVRYAPELDLATCSVCGITGIYGQDIVDTGCIDSVGHDTVKPMCRDIERCCERLSERG